MFFKLQTKLLFEKYFKELGLVDHNNVGAGVQVQGNKKNFNLIVWIAKIDKKKIDEAIKEILDNIMEFELLDKNDMYFELNYNKDRVRDLTQIEIAKDDYKYIPLEPYQLLLGYDEDRQPIIADMVRKPHVIISGLSGQGKSSMIRQMITNIRGADIILLNSFYTDDFKGLNIRHIEGEKEVIECLANIYKGDKFKRPLYIVIEELSTLRSNKQIELIYNLLCTARHKNVYIIGCCQEPLKTEYKYKSLFNTRVSFSSIDGYKAALGEEWNGILQEREFVCTSKIGIVKGKTYTLTI